MDLKLTLHQRELQVADIVAACDPGVTVGELADAIWSREPSGALREIPAPVTLQVADESATILSREALITDCSVRSGAVVSVVPSRTSDSVTRREVGVIRALSGDSVNQEFPLREGATTIGRGADSDVVIRDPLVSGQHARVVVGDTVEIVDLNSSNGVEIGGELVTRAQLQDRDIFILGTTAMQIRLNPAVGLRQRGAVVVDFPRSPLLVPAFEGVTLQAPEMPEGLQKTRAPIVAMIVPLLMGGVLFAVTRSAMSVIFVAMMPLLMVGTFLESAFAGRRAYRQRVAQFRVELADLEQRLLATAAVEQAMRLVEQPGAQECAAAVSGLTPLLWSRRPEHESFLKVRLGLGSQPSRSSVERTSGNRGDIALRLELSDIAQRYAEIPEVPVIGDYRSAGNIGFAVGDGRGVPAAMAACTELLALHAPTEVQVCVLASHVTASRWEWLKWTPHVDAAAQTLGTGSIAVTSPGCQSVIDALMALISIRRQSQGASSGSPSEIPGRPFDPDRLPEIVVIVESDAPMERSRIVHLAEIGPGFGIHLTWIAPTVQLIPAAARVYVDASRSGEPASAGFVHSGTEVVPLALETVSPQEAMAVGRGMAMLRDASTLADQSSSLPASVGFISATGLDLREPTQAVVQRWRETGSLPLESGSSAHPIREGSLRGFVGVWAEGSLSLDLRTNGPHALVGGTTGAGKSEFLQTWVLGMAIAHSPSRVNFLFVDYKGGSAFGKCVELPHAVGIVTDLSPHLVTRALTSLNAELRYREHILNEKRAKDLLELEKRGDPEAPPSLIIIVDEFAALVQEVPAFVDGVVNVAQRGRSLGLHLILATQRPAGVIKDNLRANTNLRIALRMADEADSDDVVGDAMAASFSPDLPGRAVVRLGPRRLITFQAGYAGGRTSREPEARQVSVWGLVMGPRVLWPAAEETDEPTRIDDETDLRVVVAAVGNAARVSGIPAPRKPWLPELVATYELASLTGSRSDDAIAFAVGDDPGGQTQPTVYFHPDRDGSMAVFGTGGSGKSCFLRSMAIAAGLSRTNGPSHVYAIDAGGRGLAMLDKLPFVGSVVSIEDEERIDRLITFLRKAIDERAELFARVSAGSMHDYRKAGTGSALPRLWLLIDNFGAVRQLYELGQQRLLDRLVSLASDGRQVGLHVIVSADRPGSIPSNLASALQRQLVLRLANENDAASANLPRGVLGEGTPPGRGYLDGMEVQVAVLGGSASMADQSAAVDRLASRSRDVEPAPPIRRLDERILLGDLPVSVDGLPTLGLEAASLSPVGIDPGGVFLVTGPPKSGRTTTLQTLVMSLRRWNPRLAMCHFGPQRSMLASLGVWSGQATDPQAAGELALEWARRSAEYASAPAGAMPALVVVIENIAEWATSSAEPAMAELLRSLRATGQFCIVEGESSTVTSGFGMLSAVKADRYGIALQPDQADGDLLFKTPFPRVQRRDFPPGRGLLVSAGRSVRVQVALGGAGA